MNQTLLHIGLDPRLCRAIQQGALSVLILLMLKLCVYAQSESAHPTLTDREPPLVIENVSEVDVFGFGRSVLVRGEVKHGVISFGGDVIVEGKVEGDVAAIGGSVIQRENSYIGGDVIVFGGTYHHGKTAPQRGMKSTTIMFAGNEQELRSLMRDPLSILKPQWSPVYLGQRLLAVLFWFIASLALTAVTPGAVGRAAARLRLTDLRIAVIGFLGSAVIAIGGFVCLKLLPPLFGVLVMLMASLFLLVAYLFGRVVIHVVTGRWLQRVLLKSGSHSEAVALLLGSAFWVALMSLPYLWPAMVTGLLVTSLGLALTARYHLNWRSAARGG